MNSDVIYADVTELFSNPIRSGIQRVVREFLRGWRGSKRLQPCIFNRQILDLVEIPEEAVALLTERTPGAGSLSPREIGDRVAAITSGTAPKQVQIGNVDIVVPELFFDPLRAEHHMWRRTNPGTRLSLLIYDFIPWLRPEKLGVERAGPLMHYLKLTTLAHNVAFISTQTYDDWRLRVLREPARAGVVLPLGADGLGLERQRFHSDKRNIVCLGSIDGRKNQDIIARAFAQGWASGLDLNLVLVGYVFNHDSAPAKEIARIRSRESRLIHYETATDQDVLAILRNARATIYMSDLEGYGLPPVESLHAGIPVVVANGIPSISRLPLSGQIRVQEPREDQILGALREVADEKIARRLWVEAAELNLPTWDGFAAKVEHWLR